MPPQDFSHVQLMAAPTKGVYDGLLNRDVLLADFPRRQELVTLRGDEFIPISLYMDLCDYLEQRLGTYAFLRLGRKLGAAVIASAFPPSITTVEEGLAYLSVAHQAFCRPVIGVVELVERDSGLLAIHYTAPYNCILQEGLLYEVALRYGAANATVTHPVCRRKGAAACRFEIKY